MYTDPGHLLASDPGCVEGNVVFAYLDAFDPDAAAVAELKLRYRHGGLGDAELKRRLVDLLEQVVAPIRERRAALVGDRSFLRDVLRDGTERADEVTRGVLRAVRQAFALSV
jgi:tryptophanyl-tRNA synthetase